MEFKSLTNIESSFRRIRLMLAVFVCCCTLITGYSLWSSYSFAEKQREKIYVLDGGKSLMLALSQDLSQNRPLFRGILKLQTVEDCYDFFEDLCTIAELRAMVQRFQVARMLDEGRIYSDIVQETGASTATISRVNKCLVYGSDGYRKMLDRLKEDETAEESHE